MIEPIIVDSVSNQLFFDSRLLKQKKMITDKSHNVVCLSTRNTILQSHFWVGLHVSFSVFHDAIEGCKAISFFRHAN